MNPKKRVSSLKQYPVLAAFTLFFAALFVPILVEYHQFVTVLPHLLWTALGAGVLGAALIEVNAHRNRRWQKRNYPELEVAPLNFFPAKKLVGKVAASVACGPRILWMRGPFVSSQASPP